MDNNINYIAFDFVEGNNNEISPENVEVEITALDQYKIAEYKFDNTIYDLMPEFYEGFTYTYEDIIEENITTRTIYSNSLPIKISFGQGNTEAQPRELSLLGVEYLNITNTTKIIYNLFARCQNLQYVNGVNDWDISGISDLTTVFYYCNSLTQLDLSNWDTSNVTNMYCMFRYCESLTSLDLSNWDTGNVTDMSYMFANCQLLTTLDVSNFDTSNVINMQYMFSYCNNLTTLDVSNFVTSKVTNMSNMFHACNLLTTLDLSNWNTSNVTDMYKLFCDCKQLTSLNLSNFNTGKVTNMGSILRNCTNLALISMNNSDYNSVNKVITQLPERTTDSISTLRIVGIDDASKVDISTALSKYWITRTELFKLNDKAVAALYIEDKRVMQIYLNGKPLL